MIKYLLSIEEFMGRDGEGLLAEAFSKVDSDRRRKAEGLKAQRAQAACLGAGLLLQLTVWEYLEQGEAGGAACSGGSEPAQYTVSGLLGRIRDKKPLLLAFRYGERGKPYFRDYPVYFNLSHSGDYVICAVSSGEVGVDIQKHRTGAGKRIAARFFSARETDVLENCKEGADELFFRLWTRKEAYGKLTGEGIVDALGVNLLQEADISLAGKEMGAFRPVSDEPLRMRLPDGRELIWEEYCIPGYSISVCSVSTRASARRWEQI